MDWINKIPNGRFRTVEINDKKLETNRDLKIKQCSGQTTIVLTLYRCVHEDNILMDELRDSKKTFKFVTYNILNGNEENRNDFICKIKGIEIISNINDFENVTYYLDVICDNSYK
ncbi:hypothetical protein FDC35_13315 [Clostridium botulinum]|nr:hypothetical protein [Clostridium botulinum]NFH70097.1 hypothetical protein [Clostridium botulinum]NFP01831.1 hypothetical protein [Clostridium botulinum]